MSSEEQETQEYLLAGIRNVHLNLFLDDGSKYFLRGTLEYLGNVDLALNDEEKKKLPKGYVPEDAINDYKVEYWSIGKFILRYICKKKESLASKFSWIRRSEADPDYSKRVMLLANIVQAMVIALLVAGLSNEIIFYTVIYPLTAYWGYVLLIILWMVSVLYLKLQFKVPFLNLAVPQELVFDIGEFPSPTGISLKGKKILTVLVYQSDIIPWHQVDVVRISKDDIKLYAKDAPVHELVKSYSAIAKAREELEHLKKDLNELGGLLDQQYYMGMASAIGMHKTMQKTLSNRIQLRFGSTAMFMIVMLSLMTIAGFLIFSGSTLGLIIGGAIALLTVVLMLYVFTSVFSVKAKREMLYE